jgi:hypothetical protein
MRNAETCGHGQLVEACGVFSYSPATEGARLSAGGRIYANGGHVVFDCFTEAELSGELLERWRGAPDRYPIIIPRGTMIDFCKSLGLLFQNSRRHTEWGNPDILLSQAR